MDQSSMKMLPKVSGCCRPGFQETCGEISEGRKVFFKEFSDVIVKLFELGIPFKEGTEKMVLKTMQE